MPRSRSTAKAMRYADDTLSFQDSTIWATNDRTFSININPDNASIPTLRVCFHTVLQKDIVAKYSCHNKIKFLRAIVV